MASALYKSGVSQVVLSPGSRNTPMVLALETAAAKGFVTLHTVVDERSAAFFALGLARVTGKPTALCCTSGSAGSHYYPALVEANQSGLPLVAITTDRPPSLQGCGAPQAMAQENLFGPHVRGSFFPGLPHDGDLGWLLAGVARCIQQSVGPKHGPVHINLAFEAPLWSKEVVVEETDHPVPTFTPYRPTWDAKELAQLAAELATVDRGLIVWGPGELPCPYAEGQNAIQQAIGHLASRLNWPVLTDATAGLRRVSQETCTQVGSADLLLRDTAFAEKHQPTLVLRIGRVPTSKVVAQWLSKSPTILVDPAAELADPHHHVERVAVVEPLWLFQALAHALVETSTADSTPWTSSWAAAETRIRAITQTMDDDSTLWMGAIANDMMDAMPDGSLVHVASSLAIRAINSFTPALTHDVLITANRGVNGIDGTLSTALGQASAWPGLAAVFCGDLAFLHDVGAMVTLKHSKKPMVLVVVDNRGGGIFDHLPISKHTDVFESRFITDQAVNLVNVAQGFGVDAESVNSRHGLRKALVRACANPQPHIIVVTMDREIDLAQHRAVRTRAGQSVTSTACF
jgi:2-succinyl-5-enolpyruvyl-6-hydroxy-3-cyclohexene-1-carboxylate synthase